VQTQKVIHRIIDANLNRLKEGLRVCEEITRFILDNRKLTAEFKGIRHKITLIVKKLNPPVLLEERQILKDVGRSLLHPQELKRRNSSDIFFANIQRVKESLRVLEEFSKIQSTVSPLQFKKIRYQIYELEKKVSKRLCCYR
jgi:thiamine-phosphate pyrophosphorylase